MRALLMCVVGAELAFAALPAGVLLALATVSIVLVRWSVAGELADRRERKGWPR